MEQKSRNEIKENFSFLWKEVPWFLKVVLNLCLLLFIFFFVHGCASLWRSYPQDNVVEEIAEEVIKQKTGLNLDLTPFSPEKK